LCRANVTVLFHTLRLRALVYMRSLETIKKVSPVMTAGKILPIILSLITGAIVLTLIMPDLSWGRAGIMTGIVLAIWAVLSLLFSGSAKREQAHSPTLPSFKGEMRLAASLREAIIIVNERQQIEHINPAAHKLFPDIRTGSAISTLTDNPKLMSLTENVFSGRPPEPYVYQITDPVERHIRVTASALRPNTGETGISRAIIVFYDVTDLERANAMRADFLANASHELKTPVASLLGYIETLNGHAKNDPEARTRFLGIMQQQAERMQRLISDILSLRRIELSEHKAPEETADLYLAFLAAAEAVAPMADQKQINIDYNGPKELLVRGTQDELVQLILNIIDNAVKMSTDHEPLIISGDIIENWTPDTAFPEQVITEGSFRRQIVEPPIKGVDYAAIRIRDTGPGFSKEHLPRLSERFYRIAGDRSSREKGTGLGLAIVKHIVLRHRGGLLIETAENFGTEFSILIPCVSKPAPADIETAKDQVFLNFTKLS